MLCNPIKRTKPVGPYFNFAAPPEIMQETLPDGVLYTNTIFNSLIYHLGDMVGYDEKKHEINSFLGGRTDDRVKFFEMLSEHFMGEGGICDDYHQVLARIPSLIDSDKKFCVLLTPLVIKNEFPRWRWDMFGDYIGNQKPTETYINDEPNIELVFVFEIYQIHEGL